MTFKNALAGIPFGGGKSVIVADDNPVPTKAQLQRFAAWLNELEGRYVTAEDVGMGVTQMHELARHTRFVSGVGQDGYGGDPSPKTAFGVFLGLKAAAQYTLGVEDLQGVRVVVQGLGAVGMALCQWLDRAGAELFVSDLNAARVAEARSAFNARPVAAEEVMHVEAEILAPCALGGVITETVARSLPVALVAGAANNQLATPASGAVLAERGVVYAPDFVINAGGVISVAHEYLRQQGRLASSHDPQAWIAQRINGIPKRLLSILERSRVTGETPDFVARQAASAIVQAGERTPEAA
jgi:leucine dehydrogenase